MPRNDERIRRDLEILGLELSASEGMNGASVVKKFLIVNQKKCQSL